MEPGMVEQMYKTIKSQAKTIASQAETLANQAETIAFLTKKFNLPPIPKSYDLPIAGHKKSLEQVIQKINLGNTKQEPKSTYKTIDNADDMARELSSFEAFMKDRSSEHLEKLVTEPDFNNNNLNALDIKQENSLGSGGDSGGEVQSSQYEETNGIRKGRGRPRKNFEVKPPKRDGPGRPRKDEGYGWKLVNPKTEITSDGESNGNESGRPFPCNQCEYSATQRGALKTHILSVHEKVKPFSCLKCEYSATQKGAIKIHVASVHEKIKPFACNKCPYATAHKGNLKTHVNLRHKEDAVDGTPLENMAIPDDQDDQEDEEEDDGEFGEEEPEVDVQD